MTRPAVLGGPPAFPDGLTFARPMVPPLERLTERLRPSYERGILTNGPMVAELETRVADYLGVDRVVAVSSCTSGLMLALQALDLDGPVVVPSFTFSASAHAVAWNGLELRFVECDPETFQIDVDDVQRRIDGAAGVLATHVFGAPCPVEQLEQLAASVGVPVVFDAAHAFGARRDGRRVGSGGSAEVFSMSPTKIVVAGEGGIVATDNDDIAEHVRLGRDYGNPGDYDTRFVGLNARLSELHAAMALESLDTVDDHLERRRALAHRYREALSTVPGIDTQVIDPTDESTFKDLTISVDEDTYGLSRDVLAQALGAEGVQTRPYFDPPIHRQTSYASAAPVDLPRTDAASARVLSLPMFAELASDDVDTVVESMAVFPAFAGDIRSSVAR